jgi:hypothetical protein
MSQWWAVPMLLSGGLFVGGVTLIAWERLPAWRTSDPSDFRTGFTYTLRRVDHLQPALLVVCLGSTIGLASSAGGAARTLAVLAAGGFLIVLVGSAAWLVPIQRRLVASGPEPPSAVVERLRAQGLAVTLCGPPARWPACSSPWSPPSCEDADEQCCVTPTQGMLTLRPRPGSDRQGQLIERDGHPPVHRLFDRQLVVSAADVLYERMPDDDHPGAAVLLEPSHRSQPRLEPAVVALNAVVGVPVGAVPGRRE